MKALKYIIFPLAILLNFNIVNAQSKKELRDKEKTAEIQKLLSQRRFTFIVQTVQPMRGGAIINPTGGYELVVKKDTLNSYLPYYGRAYTAPMNPSDSPLTFTTTEFTYSVENKKKGRKDITIVPKNRAQYSRQILLSISEQGYATLLITSNNRDPITYTGYITAVTD